MWLSKGIAISAGILAMVISSSAAKKPHLDHINPATLSKPNGYSHVVAVQGGRTLYLSGQVPLTKDNQLVGIEDMEAQTRQVFENLKAALAAAGVDLKDLVKITIYTTDAKQIDLIRKVRNLYLPSDQPSSTFVEVKALFRPEVMVEIDGIAVTD